MDLLTGYGSGSEDETELPAEAPRLPEEPVGRTVPLASAMHDGTALTARISALPAPNASQTPLFSGLPTQSRKKRRLVPKFSCPIDYGGDIALSDDEQEEEAKAAAEKRIAQPVANDISLISAILPSPKSYTADKRRGQKRDVGVQDGEGSIDVGSTGLRHAGPQTVPHSGNEAYRVDALSSAHYVSGIHEVQEYLYDPVTGHYFYPEAAEAETKGGDLAVNALQEALAAEQTRTGTDGSIQFKEVSGDALRYMDPGARADAAALRSALGDGFENRLKMDAAKVGEVNKLAKRKHQLASLFVQAKAQELQDMEKVRCILSSFASILWGCSSPIYLVDVFVNVFDAESLWSEVKSRNTTEVRMVIFSCFFNS